MPSSSPQAPFAIAAIVAAVGYASGVKAQQQPQGFAVERLYPSAPGGGWFVMDNLDMRGGLGGAMALTTGYSKNALRVTDGSRHLAVVSDNAFADFGFAVTYDRWRFYVNLDMPLVTCGQSDIVGDYRFDGPSVDLGSHPDTLFDVRIGMDTRFFGDASGPLRLGASAQLIVPNSNRAEDDINGNHHAEYGTDGTYRAMDRILFAGDIGRFAYAGQLGIHVRPLDDSPIPGSPRGSELLFGVAAGRKFSLGGNRNEAVVIGPEIYGETAFKSFLRSKTTGVEGLLTGRLEGTADNGSQLRIKLGAGAGLNPHFGAPEWRIVLGLEVFDHNTNRR